MATTQFNKEYLTYTKQEAKKWHLYLGGSPQVVAGRTSGSFDWGRDVNFLYRIRERDINFVTERTDWKRRLQVAPWNASYANPDHKLIYNPNNLIAYLCISDNVDNRSDKLIRGKNYSFYTPSHAFGEQSYPDGYSWYALFTIDPDKLGLVSSQYIPVPSIDDYANDPTNNTLQSTYISVCGASYDSVDGVCCLYSNVKYIDGAGITQEKGYLLPFKFVSKCYQCYETANKLNSDFYFASGVTSYELYPSCEPCGCTKAVYTQIEKIGLDKDNLNPSGSFRFLYDSYEYWLPYEKGIFSVFINLESLTDADRTIPYDSPLISFRTISGSGAVARLKTQPVAGGFYVIGIELLSRGSGYYPGDAIAEIENLSGHILNSLIEVNVTPEDFPENPSVMLYSLQTCIKTTIDNEMISQVGGSDITEFTKYGILKNVKSYGDNTNVSDGLNKNEFQVLRTTTKVLLGVTGSNTNVSDNPNVFLTDNEVIQFSDSELKKGTKAYFESFIDNTGEVTGGNMELITKDYDNIEIGDTIKADDTLSYVVNQINKPDVVFGSGIALFNQDTDIKFPASKTVSFKPRKAVNFTIIKS